MEVGQLLPYLLINLLKKPSFGIRQAMFLVHVARILMLSIVVQSIHFFCWLMLFLICSLFNFYFEKKFVFA